MTEHKPWDDLSNQQGTNNTGKEPIVSSAGNHVNITTTGKGELITRSMYSPDERYGAGKPQRVVIRGDLKDDSN